MILKRIVPEPQPVMFVVKKSDAAVNGIEDSAYCCPGMRSDLVCGDMLLAETDRGIVELLDGAGKHLLYADYCPYCGTKLQIEIEEKEVKFFRYKDKVPANGLTVMVKGFDFPLRRVFHNNGRWFWGDSKPHSISTWPEDKWRYTTEEDFSGN